MKMNPERNEKIEWIFPIKKGMIKRKPILLFREEKQMKVTIILNDKGTTLESKLRVFAVNRAIKNYGLDTKVIGFSSLPHKKEEEGQNQAEQGIEEKKPVGLLGKLFGKKDVVKEEKVQQKQDKTKGLYVDAYFVFYETKAEKDDPQNDMETVLFEKEPSIKLVCCMEKQKEVKTVCDPILWLQQKDYQTIRGKAGKDKGCVFLDIQGTGEETQRFKKEAKQSYGDFVRLAGETHDRNDMNWYIGMSAGSTKMIVDTLAGLTMALLYRRPFLYMSRGEEDPLAKWLMEIGMENHVVTGYEVVTEEERFKIPLDKKLLKNKLIDYRRSSLYYIEEGFKITSNGERVQCPTGILKKACYGCYACAEVCPTNSITMVEDREGFPYPVVNETTCIDCRECRRSCIRLKNMNVVEGTYPWVRAGKNQDEAIRMGGSSSGAIFPALCKEAIEKRNGVVFGVAYDENMNVVSMRADTLKETEKFRGSKYAKSQFAHQFPVIRELLKEGRFVLYTGVPCECAALRSYLKQDYDNLVIQEILCHCGPSQKVFKGYIKYLEEEHGSKVVDYVFRDKTTGWGANDFTTVVTFENGKVLSFPGKEDNYYRAFSNDYLCRPSCASCQFVGKYRVGDITVGDYWGIQDVFPELHDNKGVSLILLNTKKGEEFFKCIEPDLVVEKSRLRDAFRKNHKRPVRYKEERVQILNHLDGKSPRELNQMLEKYNDLKK